MRLISNDYWNSVIKSINPMDSCYDGWLDKYICKSHSPNETIVELGCGWGDDTSFLINAGYRLISCDFADEAVKIIKRRYPLVETKKFNILSEFPLESKLANFIVADLCLHYFDDAEMKFIQNEINRILKDDGLLLCRINSSKDINFGAGQGENIGNGLYITDSGFKRFFDQALIMEVYNQWEIVSISEYSINKYTREKVIWELALKKIE